MVNRLLKNHKLLAISLGGIFFVLYASMVPTQAVGLHQSDILITLASKLGTLPSPGYPLLNGILYLFISILGAVLGVAFSAHLTSAIFHAVSLSFIYLTTIQIFDQIHIKKRFALNNTELLTQVLAVISTGLTGVSLYFWRYALFAEKYSLSLLLTSIAFFLVVKILTSETKKLLFFLALTLGLGLSHQWIFIPITLTTFYILKSKFPKNTSEKAFLLGLLLSSSILPYALLFLSASLEVKYSYLFTQNLEGVYSFITQNYLGDSLAKNPTLTELFSNFDLELWLKNIWEIIQIQVLSFGYLPSTIMLGALLYTQASNTKKNFLNITLIYILVLSASLAFVFDWTKNLFTYPEIVPQLLVIFPFMSVLFLFGLYELFTRLGGAIYSLFPNKKSTSLIVLIPLLALCFLGYSRYSQVNIEPKLILSDISQNTLNEVEDEALVACFNDQSCHSLIFQQEVNDLKPEVTLFPYYAKSDYILYDHQKLQGFPRYDDYPMIAFDVITWNKDLRPVYTVDMFEEYFQALGIDQGFVRYIPYGYYSKLSSSTPEKLPDTINTLSERLQKVEVNHWDVVLEKNKLELARRHLFNTSIYMKFGQRFEAYDEGNLASNLSYDLNEETINGISQIRAEIEGLLPSRRYNLGEEALDTNMLLEEAKQYEENGVLGNAITLARGAITVDPRDIDSRLELARLLEIAEASDSAITEYYNVLQLEDSNETALERLEYQESL